MRILEISSPGERSDRSILSTLPREIGPAEIVLSGGSAMFEKFGER